MIPRTEPSAETEILAQQLISQIAKYSFGYESIDMLSALETWAKLRPTLIAPDQGLQFEVKIGSSSDSNLKLPLRKIRALCDEVHFLSADGSELSQISIRFGAQPQRIRGLVRDQLLLTALQGMLDDAPVSLSWRPAGGERLPGILTAELDRFVRVLEWACDFEAAHSILHEIPFDGFDSVRALVYLLASKYRELQGSPDGWQLMPVVRAEEHKIEQKPRSFAQAEFAGFNSNRVTKSGTRQVAAPLRRFQIARNAKLFSGGTVYTAQGLVDFDECQRSNYDFVAGRWDHVVGSSAALDSARIRIPLTQGRHLEKGILLSGRADMNWYHWMIEHMPRLIQIEDKFGPEYPVIVSARLSESGLSALRACTRREIIVVSPEELTHIDELILPGNCVFHIDTLEMPWSAGTALDFDAIETVRTRILAAIPHGPAPDSPKRVFWHRSSTHRNLTNQEDIIEVAKNWGFTVVHPEECSFEDQVRLFANADVVISAMGAVTPNFLFMRPGSSVISMTSSASADYIFPGVIADRICGDFVSLVGTFEPSGTERQKLDFFHLPFTVDPIVVNDELTRQLGAPNA